MKAYFAPLVQFQRFFIPALLCLLAWAIWRAVFRKDRAVGLVLYLALVVIVDAYLNTGLYLPGFDKGSIRYSEICAGVMLFSRGPTLPARSFTRTVTWLIWSYFALLFVSALRADSTIAGLFEFRRLIIPQIVAFLIARRGLDSPQAYRRFFLLLTVLILVITLFVFWDLFLDRVFLKSDMLDNAVYFHNRGHHRFGSFFLNPNYLGAFVVLVFPAIFVWTLDERLPRARLFGAIGLLALVFCLVETQSRSPLLSFGLGLTALIFGPSGGMSRTRRLGFFALFLVVLLAAMPGFLEHATGRFDEIEKETSLENGRSRATTWAYTLRMIADHPIGGIGFGEAQFSKSMLDYGFEDKFGVESLDAPHNSYLQAGVYAGIPALAAFLFANWLLLGKAGLIAMRGAPDGHSNVIFGMAVGLTAFLASIYTDLQLFTMNVAPVYWTFFGLLLASVRSVSEGSATKRSEKPPLPGAPVLPRVPASSTFSPRPQGRSAATSSWSEHTGRSATDRAIVQRSGGKAPAPPPARRVVRR